MYYASPMWEEDDLEIVEHFTYLEANDTVVRKKRFKETDDNRGKRLNPSIKEPSILELKELPDHLEYAFLGEGELLSVLSQQKKAIARKISDIKGTSPSFCMHKIPMEEDFKLVV